MEHIASYFSMVQASQDLALQRNLRCGELALAANDNMAPLAKKSCTEITGKFRGWSKGLLTSIDPSEP